MKLTDVELRFTEEKLERVFVELPGNESYPHFFFKIRFFETSYLD